MIFLSAYTLNELNTFNTLKLLLETSEETIVVMETYRSIIYIRYNGFTCFFKIHLFFLDQQLKSRLAEWVSFQITDNKSYFVVTC